MRKRVSNNLVFTTENSESKKRIAMNNVRRKPVFFMTVLGEKHQISEEEYRRLLNAGYKVSKQYED